MLISHTNQHSPLKYSHLTPTHKSSHTTQIQFFNTKFNDFKIKLNTSINTQKLGLNTSIKQKYSRIDTDPQIIASKLKKIENDMEMNRAEIEIDKRKIIRRKSLQQNENKILKALNKTYKQQYKNEIEKHLQQIKKNEDDQQEYCESIDQNSDHGVHHYQKLKRTPKFLKYVLKKIKSSKNQNQQIKTTQIKRLRSKNFKKQQLHTEITQNQTKLNKVIYNPENIVDKLYPKFFSRYTANFCDQDFKLNHSSNFIAKKQQKIANQNVREINDDHKRKLKQKFTQILKEISKSQKYDNKQQNKTLIKLPTILIKN